MRFFKLFLATLASFSLAAPEAPRTVSSPELSGELVQLLEKHNLALVPRSELTDALKELNTLLKSNAFPRAPVLIRRQNSTAGGGSKSGSGSNSDSDSDDSDSDDGGSRIAAIPGLDGLGDLGSGLKGLTDALGDVKDLFKALGDLLSPEFLQAFHDAMVYLAATLKPPAPNQVRNLLAKADHFWTWSANSTSKILSMRSRVSTLLASCPRCSSFSPMTTSRTSRAFSPMAPHS
ncbi:hypothetical protein NXS19_011006 [Fusarium pseudograminearum]|nr:hypothetical protein NXS19_011006 [Fusarium pseudograminearum]